MLDSGFLAGDLRNNLVNLFADFFSNFCAGLNILGDICFHRNRLANLFLDLLTRCMHVARLSFSFSFAVVTMMIS